MSTLKDTEEGKTIRGGGLVMVLLRWARGWWDQATLAKQADFHRSQVSMWERDERDMPFAALEKTAEVTGFPNWLLKPALRLLRSFRAAARWKSRPSRILAQTSVVDLFPLAAQALDLILEPLAAERARQERTEPPPPEALLERLKRRTDRQRRLLVEIVPDFRSPALADLLTQESLRLAPDHPEESKEWSNLAALIAEQNHTSLDSNPISIF